MIDYIKVILTGEFFHYITAALSAVMAAYILNSVIRQERKSRSFDIFVSYIIYKEDLCEAIISNEFYTISDGQVLNKNLIVAIREGIAWAKEVSCEKVLILTITKVEKN